MSLSRPERFTKFIERLNSAPATASAKDAYQLVCDTLNGVEDEFSSIPYDPNKWQSDGRLYPPAEDSVRTEGLPAGVLRYRSRAHNTYVDANGAVRIDEVNGPCVLNKPGHNGDTISLE
jgi:hypothetical protein